MAHEDKVAPHCDKSYFGFVCKIVYAETVKVANAVAPIADNTDFREYKLLINPTAMDSPIVYIDNHIHLLGDFRLACTFVQIRIHAMVLVKIAINGIDFKIEELCT